MVICQVIDPYDSAGSVLENSQCIKVCCSFGFGILLGNTFRLDGWKVEGGKRNKGLF